MAKPRPSNRNRIDKGPRAPGPGPLRIHDGALRPHIQSDGPWPGTHQSGNHPDQRIRDENAPIPEPRRAARPGAVAAPLSSSRNRADIGRCTAGYLSLAGAPYRSPRWVIWALRLVTHPAGSVAGPPLAIERPRCREERSLSKVEGWPSRPAFHMRSPHHPSRTVRLQTVPSRPAAGSRRS